MESEQPKRKKEKNTYSDYHKEYYKKNREKILELKKDYWIENREKVLEKGREYRSGKVRVGSKLIPKELIKDKCCMRCHYKGSKNHFVRRLCIKCNKIPLNYIPPDKELHPWILDEYVYSVIKVEGREICMNWITREEASLLIRNGYLFVFKEGWYEKRDLEEFNI